MGVPGFSEHLVGEFLVPSRHPQAGGVLGITRWMGTAVSFMVGTGSRQK